MAKQNSSRNVMFENLENRQLLAATAPRINTFYLDNRGQAEFFVNQSLDPATLSRKSASLYGAGVDNTFGTADDNRIATAVGFKKGRLTLRATVTTGQQYRVLLKSNVIKGLNGLFLDGEFNSNGLTQGGNGVAGGNLDVVSNSAAKTRARFNTISGYINVGLYKNTPNTKGNFVHYANEAAWDTTFFHRSTTDTGTGLQVIQGGGYEVEDGQIGSVHQETGIGLELNNSNLKGTIAMARTSDVNSNTNQWFFNVNDNTTLDTTGGGYTAFGVVLDTASQRTIEAINKLTIANAGGVFTELPILVSSHSSNPLISDLVLVNRVAMMMDPTATPGVSASSVQTAGLMSGSSTENVVSAPVTASSDGTKKDDENCLLA